MTNLPTHLKVLIKQQAKPNNRRWKEKEKKKACAQTLCFVLSSVFNLVTPGIIKLVVYDWRGKDNVLVYENFSFFK